MSGPHVVIVTGGRDYPEELRPVVYGQLDSLHQLHGDFVLFHGACTPRGSDEMTGADRYADDWAQLHPGVILMRRPAKWTLFGNDAGPIRNLAMVKEAVQLAPPEGVRGLAFPDLQSRGTWNCVRAMKDHDIEPEVFSPKRAREWLAEQG